MSERERIVLTLVGLLLTAGVITAAVLSYESPRNLIGLVPFTAILCAGLLGGVIRLW